MYQYPVITISDRNNRTRERLPIADLQKTFKETWNLNDTWSITFSVIETNEFSKALELIKPENIITYQGQEFIIKQPNREILDGISTYTVTAVHRYYVDASNVRRNDVSNGTITWSFQDAVNSFVNNNDQGVSVSFNGNFPKIQIENLGNSSFLKFAQDYFSKFKAVVVPDNKHWNIYSYDAFKKHNGKRIIYQNSAEDLKLNFDSTSIINQCRCLGKPIDNTNPQKYSVDFIWSNQDSIDKWGLHRGDTQSDERFTDQNSMTQFEDGNLQTDPVVTLEITAFAQEKNSYDKGEEIILIVPDINWSTNVILNHYERNPFNEIDTPVFQFDNTNIAINDVNVALNDKISSIQSGSGSILGKVSNTFEPTDDNKTIQKLDDGSVTLNLNGNVVYVSLSIMTLKTNEILTTVPTKYVPKQSAHGTFFINSDKVYIIAYTVDLKGNLIINTISSLNGDITQNIGNKDQSNLNGSFNYII